MAYSTVTTEVHQPLNIQRNLAPKVAFNGESSHDVTQLLYIGFTQVFDLCVRGNARFRANQPRRRIANAIDTRQGNHNVLLQRDVYSSNTRHLTVLRLNSALALTLLVAGVRANNANHTLTTDDFAVSANAFN